MKSSKGGLRALGLSLGVVLGLMGLMAGGAQAGWLVAGVELKTNESVAVKAASTLVLTVPSKNLEIQCTTLGSSNLKLVGSSATGLGEVKVSGCTTFSPIGSGTTQKNCKPAEPITIGGKVLLILHNGINYLLYEPNTGEAFSVLEFSELCALTETSEVTGETIYECGHLNPPGTWLILDCANSSVSHLNRPAPSALFPAAKIAFGENAAGLAGIAEVGLAGANAGKSWAGHV